MDQGALPERRSARLLIVAPQGLLLLRYHDEHKDPFWATPGGELVGDETFEAAAARELLEETGQRLPIGEALRERTDVYAVARSGPARWHERYFVVRAPAAFAPTRDGWTDEEQETIIDHRGVDRRRAHRAVDEFEAAVARHGAG